MIIDRVTLLYLRDGRLLTARSRGKTAWYLPGGKREPGESDLETLSRETREELGTDIVPGSAQCFGIFEGPAHGKPQGTLVRLSCYTAELCGEPRPSSEVVALRWMTAVDTGDAPEADAPIYRRLTEAGLLKP